MSFQDAIFVTRTLDVRYLWIDSLCVCQDNLRDWEREVAKMASVYSNSYFDNISNWCQGRYGRLLSSSECEGVRRDRLFQQERRKGNFVRIRSPA